LKQVALIIGAGQIGSAVREALENVHAVILLDVHEKKEYLFSVDVMHIAFPYCDTFVSEVKRYQEMYQPTYTVIHSTVPPGTSRQCGAVHSPVVGLHPYLYESLMTFVKFIGGPDASSVADHFRFAGMRVYLFDEAETTEVMKLRSTEFYALCIEYVKDVKRQCLKLGIPFEAWTLWTQNYNQGYADLGYAEYTRPNLVPMLKDIGGHCLLPNLELVPTVFSLFLGWLVDCTGKEAE
jgi:hypothetical protein